MRVNSQLRTVIINVTTALILVLFVEGLLWLGLQHPAFIPGFLLPYYQGYYLTQDRSIIQVTNCGTYDSDLFYTLKKGQCEFVNREFRVVNEINSAGLRDDEESLNRPSIVVFGDSFTLGWGVDQDKCYPQLLEKLTQQKVLNAGMSSYGTAREMILRKRLDLSKTQTIIIQYHPNDYEENKQFLEENFKLRVRSEYSYDSLKVALNDRTDYFPFKHLTGITKSFAHGLIRNSQVVNDTVQARCFLRVLKQSDIHLAVDEIFVFSIDKSGMNKGNFENAIDHLLNTPEFRDLPVKTTRISIPLQKSDYFILDDHINAGGHAKLAAKLHNLIKTTPSPLFVDRQDL